MYKNESEFSKFLIAQLHAIDKSIFIDSQKAGHDLRYDSSGQPTQQCYFDWIKIHGGEFNTGWDNSLCKDCKNVKVCYNCLKEKCPSFEKE